MSSDETMQVVFDRIKPHATLTEPVIRALQGLFSGRLISEFGRLPAWKIADEIGVRGSGAGFPAVADPLRVATDLRAFMYEAEFVGMAPGQKPVVLEASARLRELLAVLVTDPTQFEELRPRIEGHELIRRLGWKTTKWVVTNADGTLNIEATVEYVQHLAKLTGLPRSDIGGRRPVSLDTLFGPIVPPAAATAPVREQSESWYRQQLEQIAQAPIHAANSSVSRAHCVIHSVQASNGSINLREVIVLGDVHAANGSISGVIYLPPRFGVRAENGSANAQVYSRSYKQLYDLARKWDLLE